MRIDLGAERVIAAEKDGKRIAVEIKTFVETSAISVFHEASGQYDHYLMALEDIEPDRILYLAVPKDTFETFFQEPFVQKVIKRKNILLIVYHIQNEEIVAWIK